MGFARVVLAVTSVFVVSRGSQAALVRRQQPDATLTTGFPYSPLPWGDINIVATTDSHGWMLGHTKGSYPEPNYSADVGDTLSFMHHLKAQALARGVDLLMVDSGDLHDGNGLSDVILPGGVSGTTSNKFLLNLPYDVMTIGNHELYNYTVTLNMHQTFAPQLKGRYLTSNVNITLHGASTSVPVGSRYAKFATPHGRKLTAYGVIFSFKGNPVGTIVQPVKEMVKEPWFLESLQGEPPAAFLLVGHQPLRGFTNEWPIVINAIRAVHPTTPILIFGGHSHIRDCAIFEPRTIGIQGGRYMETLGWLSFKLDEPGSTAPLEFSRRYLDTNRNTYKYHAGTAFFDLPQGMHVTRQLTQAANSLNLSTLYGTTPQDYYLERVSHPNPNSVVTLLINEALPTVLRYAEPSRANIPMIVVCNSGALRFDILKGSFTANDQYIVSPFPDKFFYLSNVPVRLARKLEATLNKSGLPALRGTVQEQYDANVTAQYNAWRAGMQANYERRLVQLAQTSHQAGDSQWVAQPPHDCPSLGDDTLHVPVPIKNNPPFVGSPLADGLSDDDTVDVVFPHFVQQQSIDVLNQLAGTVIYEAGQVKPYGQIDQQQVFKKFAQLKWNDKSESE
ncbi:Metallo-dependent phosphatase-like protein [Auriculariales sp. MPI-PUGE-AT-0066]|nr:Metallo-dependent phosphatase-like protein [Auriculariales sp. MPI-PUGE-AT-0066]